MRFFSSERLARAVCVVAATAACATSARAWVYPEHRDIAVLAVESLDAERRAALDALWSEARVGHEGRLCDSAAETEQGRHPGCIDWAAMPAIAGDHSCSSADMLEIVTRSGWILDVADVAAELKTELARIPVVPPPDAPADESQLARLNPIPDIQRRVQSEAVRAQRLNALRTSDSRLQSADPQYATRATTNNAHFLLARPRPDIDETEYAQLAIDAGSDINAVGTYATYHLSALQKATRLAHEEGLAPAERQSLASAALADEAFGLHFLEDTFAAGHVAGTWGDSSQRKGTHDYYNENGLEVFTWERPGKSVVLMGDAHMRPEDAELASRSVRASLEQLVDAAAGKLLAVPYSPAAPATPDGFDVCKSSVFVARPEGLGATPSEIPLFRDVLRATPVPGLGAGLGSVPRFRAELGTFIGLAGAIDGRWLAGGFEESQTTGGLTGGLEIALRVGVGLDGVIGESGDGLVFASFGLHGDAPSSNKFTKITGSETGGSVTAAIPARSAIATRLRAPFFLVPGDLLALAPLYLLSPETYTEMAVSASNGGLIPWQSGWATRVGRFQLVAGRELGVTIYGIASNDRLFAPPASEGDSLRLVDFSSVGFDLPVLEYRPYRSFAGNQSSTILFQVFTGADVPTRSEVVSPEGAPEADLGVVWSAGIRMVFDWRYYE